MSIFTKIADFFENILENLLKKLVKDMPSRIKPLMAEALEISTRLRDWLKSPTADIIVAVFPGTWDDEARSTAITILQWAIDKIDIGLECGTDFECWARELAKKKPAMQDALSIKLAQLITAKADGNQLPQSQYDWYVQGAVTAKNVA